MLWSNLNVLESSGGSRGGSMGSMDSPLFKVASYVFLCRMHVACLLKLKYSLLAVSSKRKAVLPG